MVVLLFPPYSGAPVYGRCSRCMEDTMINDAFSLRRLSARLDDIRQLAERDAIKVTPLLAQLTAAVMDGLITHKMQEHPHQLDCPACRGHIYP